MVGYFFCIVCPPSHFLIIGDEAFAIGATNFQNVAASDFFAIRVFINFQRFHQPHSNPACILQINLLPGFNYQFIGYIPFFGSLFLVEFLNRIHVYGDVVLCSD